MTPDELRARADELFDAVNPRGELLRPGDRLIAEVPTGGGTPRALALVRRQWNGRSSDLVLQVFTIGPGGRRPVASGAIFLAYSSLPLLAEAVALAMEEELAANRPPERLASAVPATPPAAVTADPRKDQSS